MNYETYRLGLLLGDGVGPEIVPVAARVVDAALSVTESRVDWCTLPFGRTAIESHGVAVPGTTLAALAELDGFVVGPHHNVAYPEPHNSVLSPSGVLRKHFDLFANIRPARSCGKSAEMDLVIVRENTEGLYSDRNTFRGSGEWMPSPDVAISQGVFTRSAVERIVSEAFELARRRQQHLTVVHKANVLPLTMGMFRDVARELAPQFPDVRVDDMLVDAMAAHLVRSPDRFDVIVTENMLGDILSDLAAELSGSLGMAGSLNASRHTAMAQAAHGSAPDIAGRGVANPTGMVLSAAMLLDWLGSKSADSNLIAAAGRIRTGVARTILGPMTTADLGGTSTTAELAAAIVENLC